MSKAEAKRVLLVEDEKSIRDAVAAYLERDGFWVTPAADGAIALNAFHNDAPFDLIILDLMLPKIPREVVCKEVRNTSDVPIIMLTSKGEIDNRIADG
jgi:DNA-binding response OmpR family regulator